MVKLEQRELERIANKLRIRTLEMLFHAQAGHPGGSLSCADILAALYFNVMRIDPNNPKWEDRDRFILSKGHAAPILYATLAERGYISDDVLNTYDEINSCLQAHPCMVHTPGVDMSSGSLGQGLSVAVGMGIGAKLLGKDSRFYCLLGDGELQEGQVWEAAMAAPRFGCDNVVAIVDYNRVQLLDFVDNIVPIEPLPEKWLAFNWNVMEIDGHDIGEIIAACEAAKEVKGKPTVIIAHTIKGKGVSFMENTWQWHSKVMNQAQYDQALAELKAVEVK